MAIANSYSYVGMGPQPQPITCQCRWSAALSRVASLRPLLVHIFKGLAIREAICRALFLSAPCIYMIVSYCSATCYAAKS